MNAQAPREAERDGRRLEQDQAQQHGQGPEREAKSQRGEATSFALARFREELEKRLAEERRKAKA